MVDAGHGYRNFCHRRHALRLRRGPDLAAGIGNLDARYRIHGWRRVYTQARRTCSGRCVLPRYESAKAGLGGHNWCTDIFAAAVRFPGVEVFRFRDHFLVNA